MDTDRIQATIDQYPDCNVDFTSSKEAVDFDRTAQAAMDSGPVPQWREVLPADQFGSLDDAQRSY